MSLSLRSHVDNIGTYLSMRKLRSPRWSSWYPRNLLAGRSWVRVPAFATFSSEMEFFLSLSFLPVESASACVHSGKEVAGPLLTLETTDQHRRRMGVGASGEEPSV